MNNITFLKIQSKLITDSQFHKHHKQTQTTKIIKTETNWVCLFQNWVSLGVIFERYWVFCFYWACASGKHKQTKDQNVSKETRHFTFSSFQVILAPFLTYFLVSTTLFFALLRWSCMTMSAVLTIWSNYRPKMTDCCLPGQQRRRRRVQAMASLLVLVTNLAKLWPWRRDAMSRKK